MKTVNAHLKIQLPTGGTLVAPTNPMRDPSSDCSRVFSLLPLAASYLASTQCLLKVLELVGPLANTIKALDLPPELAASIARFLKVAEELAPCEQASTGLRVAPFVRDLLCVVTLAVNCLLGQLTNIAAVMNGVATQLNAARAAANTDLVHALQSAQNNAQIRAASLFDSIEAIQAVLELATGFFTIVGVQVVQLPSAPANADLNSVAQMLESLEGSAASFQVAIDALGGCGP